MFQLLIFIALCIIKKTGYFRVHSTQAVFFPISPRGCPLFMKYGDGLKREKVKPENDIEKWPQMGKRVDIVPLPTEQSL